MTTAKQQLKDLLTLRERGYPIPEQVVELVRDKIRKADGVVQLWKCESTSYETRNRKRYKITCGEILEAHARVKEVICSKGHPMKLVWQESPASYPADLS